MKIGIIGAGNIGGNCARQAARAGHEVIVSFSRDEDSLDRLVDELGDKARSAAPDAAVASSDIVVFAVPWGVIPEAIAQAGHLTGKIVIDTTNQFGTGPKPAAGQTAASFNASRMQGARYTKSSTPSPRASNRKRRCVPPPNGSSSGSPETTPTPSGPWRS